MMNKHSILESFMSVIAVVDSMTLVVNRYGIEEMMRIKEDRSQV